MPRRTRDPRRDIVLSDHRQHEWQGDINHWRETMIGSTAIPGLPKLFEREIIADKIRLSWLPVTDTGVTEYAVFRNTVPHFGDEDTSLIGNVLQPADTSQKLTFTDSEGTTNHFYWVRALKGLRRPKVEGEVAGPQPPAAIKGALAEIEIPADELGAPQSLTADGIFEAIELDWELPIGYATSDVEIVGYALYIHTSTGVTKSTYTTRMLLPANDGYPTSFTYVPLIISALVGGVQFVDTDTTYYFKIAAMDGQGRETELSNEDSASANERVTPPPSSFPTPNNLFLQFITSGQPSTLDTAYFVSASCRQPLNAQNLVLQACQFQVYFADDGASVIPNPAVDLWGDAVDPANTLLYDVTDEDGRPWRVDKPLTDYIPSPFTDPENFASKDFWVRARFKVVYSNGDTVWGGTSGDTATAWAVYGPVDAPVGDPPSSGVVDVADIVIDPDLISVYRVEGERWIYNDFWVGVGVDEGYSTVDEIRWQLRVKESPPTANWSSDPSTGGFTTSLRDSYLSADSRIVNGSTVFVLDRIRADQHEEYQLTVQIHNAHGWSDWLSPVDLGVSTDLESYKTLSPDDDIPTIEEFRIYTKNNPPAGGWGAKEGDNIIAQFVLGDDNLTTFWITLEAHNKTAIDAASGVWPDETILKDQGDGTLTVTGLNTVEISGFSATLNEFADEALRLGKDYGYNGGDGSTWQQVLQEFHILSNTAGNPFTLTLSPEFNIQSYGEIPNWQIIDASAGMWYQVVDFQVNIPVDVSGGSGTWGGEKIQLPDFKTSLQGPGDYYFRAKAANLWGRGAQGGVTPQEYIYATAANGTYVYTSQVHKTVLGITGADIATGDTHGIAAGNIQTDAVTQTKIQNAAVIAAKLTDDSMGFTHDIAISPSSRNDLQWTSGTIRTADGTNHSINAGSAVNISNSAWTFIYFDGTSTLKQTTVLATATGSGKILLAACKAATDIHQEAIVHARFAQHYINETNISDNAIATGKIQANAVTANEIAAGTITANEITTSALTGLLIQASDGGVIRTGSSYPRIEMDSSGFITYDSGGDKRVEIPTTSDRINFYDENGNLRGYIDGEDSSDTVEIVTDIGVLLLSESGSDNSNIVVAGSGTPGIGINTTNGTEAARVTLYGDDSKIELACDGTVIFEVIEAGSDQKMGFFGATPATQPSGYTTFSNLSTDRTCDANSTTVEELADILGTLIEDLKSLGLISA